ncbi:MAG: OmpA family protein [bacterium]|nr:OmpA family protein [bacterium]
MNHRFISIAAATLVVLIASLAQAQYKKMGYVAGAQIGTSILNEELDNVRYGTDFHVSLSYPIHDRLQEEVRAGITHVKVTGYTLTIVPIDWKVRWSFYPMERITPYIMGGVGYIFYDGNSNHYFPYGGGIEYKVNDKLYIDLQACVNYANTGMEKRIYDESNQDWQNYTLGIRIPFGCKKSTPAPKAAPQPVAKQPAPEIGKPISLEGIVFKTGSADILPAGEATLYRALATLNDYPEIVVEIHGHTDNVGADDMNLALSQSRANSVMNWLVSKGVTASRMSATGFGETKPIATNETPEGRQMNRRIEFVRVK